MNQLTSSITGALLPVSVLVAYRQSDMYGTNNYYLESRPVDRNGNMGAGMPVSTEFISKLANSFSCDASNIPFGEIPAGMLFADVRKAKEKYVWFNPPCRKYLYFSNDLNIPNGEYCLPGLIWHVEKNALKMYAYKAKRLTTNTRLYAAPFFNVSPTDNQVCLGNAKLDMPQKLTFQNLVKYWEDKFFLSEFSHLLHSNPTKTNLVIVVKKSTESFDNSELIPCKNLKVKDLLK